jgi:hypothetical protein
LASLVCCHSLFSGITERSNFSCSCATPVTFPSREVRTALVTSVLFQCHFWLQHSLLVEIQPYEFVAASNRRVDSLVFVTISQFSKVCEL